VVGSSAIFKLNGRLKMFDLTGKRALVTGAGQGVGAGIAELLSQAGASVAVNDLYEERASAVAEKLNGGGGKSVSVAFDVSDYPAVAAGVEAAESSIGPLDILVNNAGIPESMAAQQFAESDPAAWRPYIETNLYGVMNCSRAVVNGMSERKYGRIVTISSGSGTVGLNIGVSPYAAGKGGGISFMRHLALETAAAGITANTLAIGLIDNHVDPDMLARLAAGVPVGRLGRPKDIAALCLYLVSEEASWMTGQTIEINGGSCTT
jgi:NAD(P)-dependent dehydrogenase (short-subunit alcohol dehydrogenase family)